MLPSEHPGHLHPSIRTHSRPEIPLCTGPWSTELQGSMMCVPLSCVMFVTLLENTSELKPGSF